ncbi:uncharacterized protein LOC143688250 isoform X1 [Tamandua tetradactyla]|uniref:uncharacterized protein LOC143688250 isoform X1 n=1 Tax=Tamandua tetradactyla TaxID=48850 RepID=UPI0040540696
MQCFLEPSGAAAEVLIFPKAMTLLLPSRRTPLQGLLCLKAEGPCLPCRWWKLWRSCPSEKCPDGACCGTGVVSTSSCYRCSFSSTAYEPVCAANSCAHTHCFRKPRESSSCCPSPL